MREPLVEKEYKVDIKERLNVKKLYPSFKVGKPAEVVQAVKPQEKVPGKGKPDEAKKPVQTQQSVVVPANTNVDANAKIAYNESDFSADELKDPDLVANLVSLTVLKDRLAIMEDKYSKVEGRPPKELRDRLMKIRVQLKCLEKSMEEGVITIEAYTAKLNLQLIHDKKLVQYFKDKGEVEKENICIERAKLMLNELKELA